MTPAASRRGFLRGLTSLPLIGGSVALIGAPSAIAGTPSVACLESYSAWLYFERQYLQAATWPTLTAKGYSGLVPMANAGATFHIAEPGGSGVDGWCNSGLAAQRRAALVMAAVGCDWRRGE